MTISLSVAVAQAAAAAVASAVGANPNLQIRTGAKPADPETTATGTLLATIPVTGSLSASAGVITSADVAADLPDAAGLAGWFRLLTSGGTAILDGTITDNAGNGDMKLGSTTITMGVPIDLGVLSFTMPVD